MTEHDKAFQDYYPDDYSHCYGCGHLNPKGLHIKSYWEGKESVCRFDPLPYHTGGFPDYVYGGLIASLIDCHSAATASAARCRQTGIELGKTPLPRHVTAALKVDYLKPTPVEQLTLTSRVLEITEKKVVVETTLSAGGVLRAKGEAVMVLVPQRNPEDGDSG
jgi:acyl-coenzyme A thioesterase PaaI-like protein